MFHTLRNFMRVKDIRNKIFFTLVMLIIYRIGCHIPVPGVNADILAMNDQMSVFGVLNFFGGGALSNFSILAMGIMPYITASIIIQLVKRYIIPFTTPKKLHQPLI